jgi:hypothetical protein
MENATSFASPLATVKQGAVNVPWQLDYVVDAVSNASAWQIVLTILALLVAYDQCEFSCPVERKEKKKTKKKTFTNRVERKTNPDQYQIPISGTRARS